MTDQDKILRISFISGMILVFTIFGIILWINSIPKPKPVYQNVIVCIDGLASHKSGSGTCSHHGGEDSTENLCIENCTNEDKTAIFYN